MVALGLLLEGRAGRNRQAGASPAYRALTPDASINARRQPRRRGRIDALIEAEAVKCAELGRTHKSAFCKRGSVNLRFTPKATDVMRCREAPLCAKTRHRR